jgi:hypothetical protein
MASSEDKRKAVEKWSLTGTCTSSRSTLREIMSTTEPMAIWGLLTGNMRITRRETIPTEAKTCVKMIVFQELWDYLLVNKLVSTVNLTIFTRELALKAQSVSFRLFANCGYPDQSQLWTTHRKGSA